MQQVVFRQALVGNIWAGAGPKKQITGRKDGYLESKSRFWHEFGEIIEKVNPEEANPLIEINGFENLNGHIGLDMGLSCYPIMGVTKLPGS